MMSMRSSRQLCAPSRTPVSVLTESGRPVKKRLNLYWNLKYIDVRSFILTGAPIAYKTANSALAGLATCDDGGQGSFIADDPDLIVVDFNLRDDGLEVGLSGLDIAGIELFSHEGEGGEAIRGDHGTCVGLSRDPIEGSLCEIALRLECVDALKLHDGTVVPALGQGSARLGQGRHPASVEEDALREGISLGMTLIDTAEIYGNGDAEKLIGRVIAGRREQVFLVSKVWPSHVAGDGIERALCAIDDNRMRCLRFVDRLHSPDLTRLQKRTANCQCLTTKEPQDGRLSGQRRRRRVDGHGNRPSGQSSTTTRITATTAKAMATATMICWAFQYCGRFSNSGSLAMWMAMRRASSRVRRFAADRRPG